MSEFALKLQENYRGVEARMLRACQRAGRARSEVTLIAVTKYAKLEWIEALLELGQRDFGENRPQQLIVRAAQLGPSARWHLIGHLQSNKARAVLPSVSWIHSLDSLKVVEIVDRLAAEQQLRPQVLLEVNVTGEATKYGFTAAELRDNWNAIQACRNVELQGLMTMAAASADPEAARPAFGALCALRAELQARLPEGRRALSDLSMGMTGDFEVAIEEGATLVRIGSALFEGLA